MEPKVPKSPAFSFYAKDFMVDTLELTTEQVGAYWLLLCAAWVGLPGFDQCYLPSDDARLARLARLTEEEWCRIGAPVRTLFQDNGKGALFSKRLLTELAKQRARSGKAKESAERRWHPAGGEPPVEVQNSPMRSQCDGNAADADEDANADEDGMVSSGKRGSGGETAELGPYLRALEVLWPDGARVRPLDVERAAAALAEVRGRGELPAPEAFAGGLWTWSLSEDWAEQEGRFVPTAEAFVLKLRWRKRPLRCPIAEADIAGKARREAARNAIAEPELEPVS